MDMIQRTVASTILNSLKPGFINIIYGPRRVGKTVLLKQLADTLGKPGVWFDGDHQETRDALSSTSPVTLTGLVNHNQVVYVDEAQRIPNIGLSLKILIDLFPQKIFFVTGSSALALSHGIQETLTGRTLQYKLYPLSTTELTSTITTHQKSSFLESQLTTGGYPQLLFLPTLTEKREYLKSIVDGYLFRDVLELKSIEQPDNLRKLTTLLAFQIGSIVSYNELANNLTIDVKTVIRYLSLLKQSFVIFELGSYARNLRKEVAKSKKYYFWDLGIRNALIDQFHSLNLRSDKGQLWENFLAVERLKKLEYSKTLTQCYFWRTYEQAEIDWIEEANGILTAYEFKLQKKQVKTPKTFKETYSKNVSIVSKENYLDFIT